MVGTVEVRCLARHSLGRARESSRGRVYSRLVHGRSTGRGRGANGKSSADG